MFKSTNLLICFISSFLLITCKDDDIKTRYDDQGVVTQIPYKWRSSISDGAFGQKLFNGYTVENKGVLCELKREADGENTIWKSSLALKDFNTGENLWVWDDFYDKRLIRTLNDDIAVVNNKIWVHDLKSDYCIDASNGTTLWKYQRTFSAVSEACNIGEDFYFIANGQTAGKEGKIADSFFRYNPDGQGFTEIGQPPYNQQYAFDNGQGYYIGSLKDIYAFRRDNTDYMVVSYLEKGPKIGPTNNDSSNRTFFGLYNLTLNKWIYDRVPVSREGEFGALSMKPIVNGNNVYLTSGTFALCFDLFTQKKKWELRLTMERYSTIDMILVDDKLLVNMDNATLYCLDAKAGTLRWSTRSNSLTSDLYHQNGIIYWVPLDHLRAVDLETGKLLWDLDYYPEKGEMKGSISKWKGFVTGVPGKNGEKGKIFATTDHYLYCFDAIR